MRHVEYVSGAGRRGSRGPYRLSSGDVAGEPLWVSLLSFLVWYLGRVVYPDPAGTFYGLVGTYTLLVPYIYLPIIIVPDSAYSGTVIIRISLFALIKLKLDSITNID